MSELTIQSCQVQIQGLNYRPSKSSFFLQLQIFSLKILPKGISLKCHENMLKEKRRKNFYQNVPFFLMPVFPTLHSKVDIVRRFLKILRRHESARLQHLEALV